MITPGTFDIYTGPFVEPWAHRNYTIQLCDHFAKQRVSKLQIQTDDEHAATQDLRKGLDIALLSPAELAI